MIIRRGGERVLGRLSKYRAILVCYDKKASNYLGLIKPACALLWYRRRWRLSVLRYSLSPERK